MKVYEFKTSQLLPTNLETAWDFFSSPKNLKEITPDYLGFKITSSELKDTMFEGQIINYTVKPVLGIPLRWTTEITHVAEHKYFVDEQRFGPYALWHHQHWFEATENGVLMTDIVHYALPLGYIGRLANRLFVRKQLAGIFSYRTSITDDIFSKNQAK